jgi:hypothetical protein
MRADLLRTLAINFGSNSPLAAKAMREAYLLDPSGFGPAAEEVLRTGEELPGASFLMAILVGEADWLRTVCDPDKYTLQQSLELVRRARKLDPLTEVKLAKMLASQKMSGDENGRFASRVLEVLERSPDPSTALPALRQLSQCENAHVRSKAVLLIGRIIRNPQWAGKSVSEGDPRVAANAIESLWGLDSPSAREAFFRAARDQHHRIAANGIVGLYLMGDECSIAFLFHLSNSKTPASRAAAAWTMGHLEDPRFLPRLARMMEDKDQITRKAAFRSIARIRRRTTELRAAGALPLQLREVVCRGSAHTVQFTVTKDGQFVKGLDSRQFVAWSGPDLVEEFSSSFQEGPAPYYEIAFDRPPSPTHLVKVQIYSAAGVGEDTGFETYTT